MDAARHKLLRVAGVIGVVCLLLYSSVTSDPIIIANPPVTRRPKAFLTPYPEDPKCGTLVNSGNWTDEPIPVVDECTEKSLYASCNLEAVRRWEWGPAAQSCGAQYFLRSAAQELLAGRWVACVGDSIARNLCAGVMRVLGAPPSAFLFDKHTDFERTIAVEGQDAVKISFTWAPFPQNASETILGWRHEKKPALLVTSVALWHMLYEQDAAMYGQELIRLSEATAEMIPKLSDVAKPVTVLTTGTEVHHERLLTAEKRAAMTSVAVDAYNEALQGAGALAPSGPFGMLDMFAITYGCGIECSVDGVHSQPQVYDAATQILLNIFKQCDGTTEECWA